MSKMLEDYYHDVVEMILKYYQQRKILFWDKNTAFQKVLSEYGLAVAGYVSEDKNPDKGVLSVSGLKYHASAYYLVIADKVRSKSDVSLLKSMGMREGRDFVFLRRTKIVIPPSMEEYSDTYGNTVHNNGLRIVLSPYCFHVDITVGKGSRTNSDFSINVFRNGHAKVHIGNFCKLRKGSIRVYGAGQITIGDYADFGEDTSLVCLDNNIIQIGRDALFARQVTIFSGDGHAIFDMKTGKRTNLYPLGDDKGKVIIGDHVWLGFSVMVLNHAEIGNSCVVGACSLFKGKLPDNCIAAGNPARIIREGINWAHSPFAESIEECYDLFDSDEESTPRFH